VRDVAQKDGDLRSRDEAAFASAGIAVHRSGAVMGRTKATCSPNDVQAGLRRAQPVRVGAATIGQGLAIVIVFLLAKVQGCKGVNVVGCGVDIVDAAACGSTET
jgi:hypothetical protein